MTLTILVCRYDILLNNFFYFLIYLQNFIFFFVIYFMDCNDRVYDLEIFMNEAFGKYDSEELIAKYIKEKFDRKYDETWHCVVGKSFGSCISYDDQYFCLQFGPFYVELWQT